LKPVDCGGEQANKYLNFWFAASALEDSESNCPSAGKLAVRASLDLSGAIHMGGDKSERVAGDLWMILAEEIKSQRPTRFIHFDC
jgi:hypothetical protein